MSISLKSSEYLDVAKHQRHGFLVISIIYECKPCELFACWVISSANFFKDFLSETIECHTVWFQIRTDVLSVLIWLQTVCKGYQQMTSTERVKRLSIYYRLFHLSNYLYYSSFHCASEVDMALPSFLSHQIQLYVTMIYVFFQL